MKHSVYILKDMQFINSRDCLLCKITCTSYETVYIHITTLAHCYTTEILSLSEFKRYNDIVSDRCN